MWRWEISAGIGAAGVGGGLSLQPHTLAMCLAVLVYIDDGQSSGSEGGGGRAFEASHLFFCGDFGGGDFDLGFTKSSRRGGTSGGGGGGWDKPRDVRRGALQAVGSVDSFEGVRLGGARL